MLHHPHPGDPGWTGLLPDALRKTLIAKLFFPSAENLRYHARHDQHGVATGQVTVGALLRPMGENGQR